MSMTEKIAKIEEKDNREKKTKSKINESKLMSLFERNKHI